MVSSLGVWKDRFFWVSEEIVPFKLVWRHPDAVLNEPEPSASDINARFLETLRECPSRLRPFPEHLLVLLCLSKLWGKRDRDPVLLRDGQGMHLFLLCCYVPSCLHSILSRVMILPMFLLMMLLLLWVKTQLSGDPIIGSRVPAM
ncbi:hypothetical protein HanLR1_Chr12g0443311 [Helianthus annuus]|nr:hypothetical protein HanLR1_Chr12g0443311 [Helianthus annuus]